MIEQDIIKRSMDVVEEIGTVIHFYFGKIGIKFKHSVKGRADVALEMFDGFFRSPEISDFTPELFKLAAQTVFKIEIRVVTDRF